MLVYMRACPHFKKERWRRVDRDVIHRGCIPHQALPAHCLCLHAVLELQSCGGRPGAQRCWRPRKGQHSGLRHLPGGVLHQGVLCDCQYLALAVATGTLYTNPHCSSGRVCVGGCGWIKDDMCMWHTHNITHAHTRVLLSHPPPSHPPSSPSAPSLSAPSPSAPHRL